SLALSTEAAGGGSKSAGGGMEEEKTRLWGEIGKLNEEIGKDIDTLYKNGKITKAEYENYKKNQARIDAMPEGEEKARAQQILAQQMENWAKGKRDEYIQQGDQQSADLAGRVEDRSARVGKITDKIGALSREEEKARSGSKVEKVGIDKTTQSASVAVAKLNLDHREASVAETGQLPSPQSTEKQPQKPKGTAVDF
ncbi:MAG: hypothetical protein ACK529_00725, partial [Alphaproteobacteria bacterium]